jgi:hypothetical protein
MKHDDRDLGRRGTGRSNGLVFESHDQIDATPGECLCNFGGCVLVRQVPPVELNRLAFLVSQALQRLR